MHFITAAGVVPCGGDVLRNQSIIIGLDSFLNKVLMFGPILNLLVFVSTTLLKDATLL